MSSIISVIIPVYNHAEALERSLFSLYKQVCRSQLQVIIVNDGSTDNFYEVIQKIQTFPWGKELNPKVINVEHRGANVARNRGLDEATGEFVIFWDADTIAKPEMIMVMYQTLLVHPEATYVYSQFKFGWKTMKCRPFDAAALRKCNFVDTTSLVRRADVVKFDESLKRFHDWDVWLTLLEQNKIGVFIPHVLFSKLVNPKKGISSWQPSFMYKLPWKTEITKKYEAARDVIVAKHHLSK